MTAHLPDPDAATTARLLRPVGYDERLVGYEIDFPLRARPLALCSLPEVLALLQRPHHRLDLLDLARWCDRVLDDAPLALAVAQAVVRHDLPDEQDRAVVELVELRLLQAMRCACEAGSEAAAPLEPCAKRG